MYSMLEHGSEINIVDSGDNSANSGFQKPALLGYFSVSNGEYRSDASQLKYVFHKFKSDTCVNFNLNHNKNKTVKRDQQALKNWEKLDSMFMWLILNTTKLLPLQEIIFFTFRGNLMKILYTPYENSDDWTICAKLHDGIIYLTYFETEKEIEKINNISPFHKECQSWGFKFEQFVLSGHPEMQRDLNKPLDENDQFCCVFQSQIANHKVVYSAEMDGVSSTKAIDLEKLSEAKFVELKTNAKINNFKQDKNFRRYKLIKWWIQCHLAGVERVICGFRNDQGIVKELKHFSVQNLPKLGELLWNKNVCFNFCVRFLDFVKRIVLESDPKENVFWRFDSFPGDKIKAIKVTGTSKYTDGFKEVDLSEELVVQKMKFG